MALECRMLFKTFFNELSNQAKHSLEMSINLRNSVIDTNMDTILINNVKYDINHIEFPKYIIVKNRNIPIILHNIYNRKWFDTIAMKYYDKMYNDVIYSGLYVINPRFIMRSNGIITSQILYDLMRYGYLNKFRVKC